MFEATIVELHSVLLLCQYNCSTLVGIRAGLLLNIRRPEEPIVFIMISIYSSQGTYKFSAQIGQEALLAFCLLCMQTASRNTKNNTA